MAFVAIQSIKFPNAFLRMDGSNVTQFAGNGNGTVNCQFYDQSDGSNYPIGNVGNLEVFILDTSLAAGAIWLASFTYAQAFLRMDGSDVTQFDGSGSGTVNCQYYGIEAFPTGDSSNLEHFIMAQPIPGNPGYYIRSGVFPNAFLRMDGSNVTQFEGSGSGTVNCQFYPQGSGPTSVDDYEVFNIIYLS